MVDAEMDILDDDWLIPDGFLNYWTVLHCNIIMFVYRKLNLTFDLTLADHNHKIN